MSRSHVARFLIVSTLFASTFVLAEKVPAQNVSGAVAHWPFDDGTNPTHDVVGGHDGTLNGPTFTSTDVAPMPGCGRALLFDGQSTVSVPNAQALSFASNQAMSIALWFKVNRGQLPYHIMGKRDGCQANSTGINYQLAGNANNRLEFNAEGGGIITTNFQPRNNTWTHVVVTYDGTGELRIYAHDGQQADTLTLSNSYVLGGANAANLLIGGSGSCGGDFIGVIDEVWIFDRPLSPAEIQLLASQNPSTYCEPEINSLGCRPTIGWTGSPSLTGPDNFHVTAANVLNNKSGLLFWGAAPAEHPFFGGTLCVASPVIRTAILNSGGNPPPNDCSGAFSFHFSQSYMSAHIVGAGTSVYAQFWSRDPGFAPPNNVGLTDGLLFVVCP
jgi:hypothetical protein